MAASRPWRFYVYALTDGDQVVYVGKGSGRRLHVQRRTHGCDGYEVARFKRERDAYAHEIRVIAELSPARNKHPGGNGSRATPARTPRAPAWMKEIDRIGSRVYAARLLLSRFAHIVDPSKVDAIRRVAYGAGS
jgi:hypothetical protein